MTTIFTIGHWNHTEEAFLSLLARYGVEMLVDVRSIPGSRRSPQYGMERLTEWIPAAGIQYQHMPSIGGRRRNQDVDPATNAGWENKSFKNYADFTLTREYDDGIGKLQALAGNNRVAYMCGEPLPWRCHRSIISNTLSAHGWDVEHIFPNSTLEQHQLGKYGAKPYVRQDGRLVYPLNEMQEVLV